MDIIEFKKAIVTSLTNLSWPQRLNGFQISIFETIDGVRQYSTGLPPSDFRDVLEAILNEAICRYEESSPLIREDDVDAAIKKSTGKSAPKLPPVEFMVTVLKQPSVKVAEKWWTSNKSNKKVEE